MTTNEQQLIACTLSGDALRDRRAWIAGSARGALWATAPNDNKIFRMTTNGAVSEFPLPAAASQSNAITVGPDGGVWFTEAEKIGRLGK